MTNPVSVNTDWYQCNSCKNFVSCNMRLDARMISDIKEKGDCPDYVYSCTTRLRATFRWFFPLTKCARTQTAAIILLVFGTRNTYTLKKPIGS